MKCGLPKVNNIIPLVIYLEPIIWIPSLYRIVLNIERFLTFLLALIESVNFEKLKCMVEKLMSKYTNLRIQIEESIIQYREQSKRIPLLLERA